VVDGKDGVSWSREGKLLVRTLKRVSLLEVSPVTWPAYTATNVTAIPPGAPPRSRQIEGPH
jgi:phage head maturation protease